MLVFAPRSVLRKVAPSLCRTVGPVGQRGLSRTLHAAPIVQSAVPEVKELGDLTVTKACAKRIAELRRRNPEKADGALRIVVEGGGCSGFQYSFEFGNQAVGEEDIVFDRDGQRVVVDDVSLQFIRGATVDFKEDLIGSAFAIVGNPNAEASCGCGTSFGLKEGVM